MHLIIFTLQNIQQKNIFLLRV